MESPNENVAVVRRLYEARGNPDVTRQVLAPDVCWEVVAGFPHSDIYHGLPGVADFFTRLFDDFEEWRTEPSEFFESDDRPLQSALIRHGRKRLANFQSAVRARLDFARWRYRPPSAMLRHGATGESFGQGFQQGSDVTDTNSNGQNGKSGKRGDRSQGL